MKYKVSEQSYYTVESNGYFSCDNGEIEVNIVQCSNRLVPIVYQVGKAVYIDLENGNVLSAYRPGGDAFLLGNIVEFFDSKNYTLELSNMVYWLESYCFGECTLQSLGEYMAENPKTSSVLTSVLMSNSQQMGEEFRNYIRLCGQYVFIMIDVFVGRKSRQKEMNMLSVGVGGLGVQIGAELIKILSYLRARNKDFETLYCRDKDTFYVTIANKYGVAKFGNKDDIVKVLREIHYLSSGKLVKYLRAYDTSLVADFHDFALDLEKISRVWSKI